MTPLERFRRRLAASLGLSSAAALNTHIEAIGPELEAWAQRWAALADAEKYQEPTSDTKKPDTK